MRNVRRWFVGATVAAGLLGSAPLAAPAAQPTLVLKSCSGGFTTGLIDGATKCLRRGQFCKRSADRQYRRYGFRCTQRDARGNYHLT